MKKLSIALSLSLLLLFSCDEDLGLLDTSVSLTKTFNIDIPEDGPTTFSVEKTFDASAEPSVEDIIDEIEGYSVDELSFKILNYDGDQTHLIEATLIIEDINDLEIASVTLNNIDLEALNGAGKQILNIQSAELEAVESALKLDNAVDVILSAEVDNQPVAFDLELLMDLTVEYRVF